MNKVQKVLLVASCALALAFTACGGSKATVANVEATGNKRLGDAPEIELERKLTPEQKSSIPWGIGIGVSTDRQMARTESIGQAQAAVARNAQLMVTGLLDDYAKNVNGEARRIAEDKINNFVHTQIQGSYVFETIMEFNEQEKKYSVYTLVLLDPSRIGEALKAQKELELLYGSAQFQKRLEQKETVYNELLKR